MAKDPAAVAQNWANRLGQSQQAITDGVNRVTRAPGAAAAAQKAVWQQNTAAAADKWARRTASVTLGDWQQAMTEKGVARIGQGATAAVPKMTAFMQQLLPFVDSTVSSLPARGDFNANVNRMVQFVTKMKQFKRT